MLKVHPDKFSDFLSRGEQYVLFMTNGVGIINTAMDVVRTKATEAFTNMGQLNTGKVSNLHTSAPAAGGLETYSPCVTVPRQVRGSGCWRGGRGCGREAWPRDYLPGRADDGVENTARVAFGVTALVATGTSALPAGL